MTIDQTEYNVIPQLNSLLERKRLTQTQLSELTGIPQGTISRFDKNERHVAWHLFAIADALDVCVQDLFHVKRL